MAQDRQTRIPEEELGIPEPWEIDGDPFTVPADEPDQLEDALQGAKHILRLIGGAVTILPIRRQLGGDAYVTTEYLFKWNSYVPPVREQPVEEQPDVEPVAAAA